jgi:hypothetical protein
MPRPTAEAPRATTNGDWLDRSVVGPRSPDSPGLGSPPPLLSGCRVRSCLDLFHRIKNKTRTRRMATPAMPPTTPPTTTGVGVPGPELDPPAAAALDDEDEELPVGEPAPAPGVCDTLEPVIEPEPEADSEEVDEEVDEEVAVVSVDGLEDVTDPEIFKMAEPVDEVPTDVVETGDRVELVEEMPFELAECDEANADSEAVGIEVKESDIGVGGGEARDC